MGFYEMISKCQLNPIPTRIFVWDLPLKERGPCDEGREDAAGCGSKDTRTPFRCLAGFGAAQPPQKQKACDFSQAFCS